MAACLGMGRTGWGELVAYWNFDEGSGTALDQVNGNVATLYGNATYSSDVASVLGGGYSLALDGSGDYASAPDSPSLSPTHGLTLSAWYKATDFTGSGSSQNILAKSANSSYRWRFENDGQLWGLINDGTSLTTYFSGVDAPEGDWHHTALIADFGLHQLRFYLDGALVATNNMTKAQIADSTGALLFGAYSTTGEFFNGLLDEVAIWDQVIPDTSIQALADGRVTPITASLPEPSTLAMLAGLAGVGLLGYLRRRRRS